MSTISSVEIDGEKLRRFRESRLWTRRDLAEMAAISEDQVGRIERGATKKPQMGTIKKLVAALDIEPGEILKDA